MTAILEGFVPIEELAKHFSVSISTVRAWVRQELIARDSYIKVGTTYRFLISRAQESLMESQMRLYEAEKEAARKQAEEESQPEPQQDEELERFEQQPLEEGDEELQIDLSFADDDNY